jgi:hypothetical protein
MSAAAAIATNAGDPQAIRRQARHAGLLYLVGGPLAPFCLIFVPRALVVVGDAAATAARVRDSEFLLRAAIGSEMVVACLFIFVALALYHLFKPVHAKQALAMMVLLLIAAPISFLIVIFEVAALMLVRSPAFASAFDPRQIEGLVLMLMRLHGQGLIVVSIFWGLWLVPFGVLVMRCGWFPRVLGVLLIIAGAGYVAAALASLLTPQLVRFVAPVAMASMLGELPMPFWLLIWGLGRPRPAVTTGG